jgi:hypothetical protein
MIELQHMEERDGLHPEMGENGRHYLSSTSYTLSKEEKENKFECLSSIKGPIWILLEHKRNPKYAREKIHKPKVL